MREIKTQISIDASAELVWSLLTDFGRYAEWNPFVTEATGHVEVGQRLRIRIEPPGGRAMTFSPVVVRASVARELRWIGRLVVPGLFDGEHIFEIQPTSETSVLLHHREEFRGILVPMLWDGIHRSTKAGFEEMNRALKQMAERNNSGPEC